jgi:hypothetical protein
LVLIIQTVIAVGCLAYFATFPVRQAFDIGDAQQSASSDVATPHG